MLCQKNMVADLVPVDIVINLMICTAWRTATNRTKSIPIYHCCTGQQNPITWQQFVELILKYNRMHPPNDTIWWPDGKCHTFAIVNNVCKLFQHLLPAHILDFILRLRGKPAIMVGLHEKIDKAVKCLEYFTMQQWTFRDDNVRQLSGELSPEDRQIFMFDVKQIDWPSYLEQYILGIRQFIIKDSPETLPAARSHIKK